MVLTLNELTAELYKETDKVELVQGSYSVLVFFYHFFPLFFQHTTTMKL